MQFIPIDRHRFTELVATCALQGNMVRLTSEKKYYKKVNTRQICAYVMCEITQKNYTVLTIYLSSALPNGRSMAKVHTHNQLTRSLMSTPPTNATNLQP